MRAQFRQVFIAGQAARIADVPYSCLNHWARIGLVTPTVQTAAGPDTTRVYAFGDVVALRVVGLLRAAGLECDVLRPAAEYLQARKYGGEGRGVVYLVGGSMGVKETRLASLASAVERDRKVSWTLSLTDVIDDVIASAALLRKPSRGRASKVAHLAGVA